MSEPFLLTLAFVLGATISLYQPMNGMVSRIVGSPLLANLLFFLVAVASTILMLAVTGRLGTVGRLRGLPPLLWIPGACSALMVLGTIILIPRLGARRLFILQVAGQVLMAMLVGHFGLLGTPIDPLGPRKIAGALLLLLGAFVSLG